MDLLLRGVTEKAFNYALRTGVSITTAYALKQCGRLLNEAPRGKERQELMLLQARLESKIRIISPAIDMIDLISARGNTSLDSALILTRDIRADIQSLGVRLNKAADGEAHRKTRRASSDRTDDDLARAIIQIKTLLIKIEDAVPLISLAITTSGVNLSTKLSGTISPSRLLQSSAFLSAADAQYSATPGQRQQVGPTYVVSMYMLFAGHARPVDEEGIRETTWKEVMHKAKLKLHRVPLDQLFDLPSESTTKAYKTFPGETHASEFAYQLVVVEDLDDERYHDEEELRHGPFEDVPKAGIRDIVPIHEISKIFYADTGKILNIGSDGDTNKPVLLLRRDIHAEPPRRMARAARSDVLTPGLPDEDDEQSEIDAQIFRESTSSNTSAGAGIPLLRQGEGRLPADLDPEWLAFEVFTEEQESDSEDESIEARLDSHRTSADLTLANSLSSMRLRSQTPISPPVFQSKSTARKPFPSSPDRSKSVGIKTSLSLLEMLLKLAALQGFRQQTHLSIEDELLNFFLEESSTAGSGPDKDYRARLRHDAVRRVGFDPYDESPIKRRKEEYIRQPRAPSMLSTQQYSATAAYEYDEDEPVRSIESPSALKILAQPPSRATTPSYAALGRGSRSPSREPIVRDHAPTPAPSSSRT